MKVKKNLALQIVIWKEGRQYVAQCLNVDVSSFGQTKKDALKNIQEALELYFEDPVAGFHEVSEPTLETHQLQYA